MRRAVPLLSVVAWITVLAPPSASAHLSAEPAFVAAGSKERIVLTVHNDRDATMTGFRLTVPDGFRILDTGGDGSWNESVDGGAASWTGGSLAAFRPATFEVELQAGVAPGPVVLRGDQLYAGEDTVSWPVSLTVVPPDEKAAGDGAVGTSAIVIMSVLGMLVVGTFALVFWQRRRDARLQEK